MRKGKRYDGVHTNIQSHGMTDRQTRIVVRQSRAKAKE